MAKFSVKNIQVGHPKDTNNEKKFNGRKHIFFCFKCINTAKKIKNKKNDGRKNIFFVLNVFNTAKKILKK